MNPLTGRQLKRLEEIERDHSLIGHEGGSPILRRADGQLLILQPDGRLVTTTLVSWSQTYLDVQSA